MRCSQNKTELGFPAASDGKECAFSVGEPGSAPGSGRSPREGNGYLLQYSCLENSMDRGAWGLQSMELQRVRHNLAINTFTLIQAHKREREERPGRGIDASKATEKATWMEQRVNVEGVGEKTQHLCFVMLWVVCLLEFISR